MMEWFEAHPITYFILSGSMAVPPFFLLATYVFSEGAEARKGLRLGWIWLVFGAVTFCACLFDVGKYLGLLGNLLIPIAWLTPSFLLWVYRDWALSHPLSQRWLVALQLFRAIGGIFLIEMVRGNLPGIFAYPAGIGDLIVAMIALIILLRWGGTRRIPSKAIYFLIGIGVLDFISAFFFGFFSSDVPFRIFNHDIPSGAATFPSGLIPYYLVPCAIFFHTLSWINQRKFGDNK